MNNETMLTTFDNPFNPFEDFRSWFLYDIEKGYNTCSYLARIAEFTDDMTELERNAEVERAIDEIIKYDFMNMYKKIVKENENQSETTGNSSEISENEEINEELS